MNRLQSNSNRGAFLKGFLIEVGLYRKGKFRPLENLDVPVSIGMFILAAVVAYYLMPYPGVARLSAIVLVVFAVIHLLASHYDWKTARKRRQAWQCQLADLRDWNSQQDSINEFSNDRTIEFLFDDIGQLDEETLSAIDSMLEMNISENFRRSGMLPPADEAHSCKHNKPNIRLVKGGVNSTASRKKIAEVS